MDEFSVFVFGMLVVIVLIFLAIGKWYPGSGAEQVDWKPTRSPELEVELEMDDLDQMLEAQNERRRARGAPEITEDGRGGAGRRGRALAPRAGREVARVLVVGCGCRGRELGAALLGRGSCRAGHVAYCRGRRPGRGFWH